MTGEISVHGKVKPVGGVISKIEAARNAGIKKVLIPQENWLNSFGGNTDIQVAPVRDLNEVLQFALIKE
jgi:Lon-like ATP-dependent protease